MLITFPGSCSDSSKDAKTGFLSENTVLAIKAVATERIDPSPEALKAHIADLELDLHNTEFHLQYLYNQHLSTLGLLAAAKGHADKLKQ
jgi:hypothetical protein